MLTFILLAVVVVGSVALILHSTLSWKGWPEITVPLAVIFGLGFGSLLSFVIPLGIVQSHPNQHKEETFKLAALGNDSSISGDFFLGSGTVNGYQVYTYITEDAEGGYHLHQVRADNITVYQDAEEGAATYVKDYKRGVDTALYPWPGGWDNTKSAFHVPPGSVDNQYNVNVSGK